MKRRIPELLAPAGSMEALKAAVNAGADAVYISGKLFGARYYASNFTNKQLEEAVNFAHLRGVKVYITVNTLIKDNELEDLAEYLIFLYKIGVDAILVQDIGVISIAKKIVPDLNLHASTQMTIHNLEGVKWAAEVGFKRVVLSREMKLSEIRHISKNIDLKEIELEIFAHGALCYSYSGQCVISSFIGGRSGNRGKCAQPCRKPYTLVLGKKDEYGRPVDLINAPLNDKYLLSTRDLCLYNDLDKILDLNLSSLKIEGRMRSPEYVAIVVNLYRKALDSIKKDGWKPKLEDINKLKLAFNRDFTRGYLTENYQKVMGRSHPGNRGILIGSVKNYNPKIGEVLIETNGNIIPQKGDGIVFISPNKKDYGMLLSRVVHVDKNKFKFKVKRPISKNAGIYLTRSKLLMDESNKLIDYNKKVPLDLNVSIQNDGGIIINSFIKLGESKLSYEFIPSYKMEKARNMPVEEDVIIKQFKKSGETPFIVNNLSLSYSGCLFAPISELNQIRRDLFKNIETNIISSHHPSRYKLKNAYSKLHELNQLSKLDHSFRSKKPKVSVHVDSFDVLVAAVKSGCKKVYFNPFNIYNPFKCREKFDMKEMYDSVFEAFSFCRKHGIDFNLKLPKITSDDFLNSFKPFLMDLFKEGVNGFMVDGIGTAKFMSDLNSSVKLSGYYGLNIWNFESINGLKSYIKCFTISPELSIDDIKILVSNEDFVELELMVQGNLDSLVSFDCLPCLIDDKFFDGDLFLGIRDIKDRVFPLKLDNECRTIVLNSVELSLIDYIPKISSCGIDFISLNLEGKNRQYASMMCYLYNEALVDFKKIKKFKNDVKNISLGGITKANFIKGTI